MKRVKWLNAGDRIVAAYAESVVGPGWANSPVWVFVHTNTIQKYRMECLQPNEQNAEILTLYALSAMAHRDMTQAVRRLLKVR